MPFVQRDKDGAVHGAYAVAQPGYAEEWLADDDAAVAAFLTAPPGPTAKADLWRRATDIEAVQMAAALAQQPVRIQQIYIAATQITRDDELWQTLYAGMVGLFGQKRADVLLAPSD